MNPKKRKLWETFVEIFFIQKPLPLHIFSEHRIVLSKIRYIKELDDDGPTTMGV